MRSIDNQVAQASETLADLLLAMDAKDRRNVTIVLVSLLPRNARVQYRRSASMPRSVGESDRLSGAQRGGSDLRSFERNRTHRNRRDLPPCPSQRSLWRRRSIETPWQLPRHYAGRAPLRRPAMPGFLPATARIPSLRGRTRNGRRAWRDRCQFQLAAKNRCVIPESVRPIRVRERSKRGRQSFMKTCGAREILLGLRRLQAERSAIRFFHDRPTTFASGLRCLACAP